MSTSSSAWGNANAKSKLIHEAVKFVKDMNVSSAKTILGNRQIFVSSMGMGLTAVEKQRTGKRNRLGWCN